MTNTNTCRKHVMHKAQMLRIKKRKHLFKKILDFYAQQTGKRFTTYTNKIKNKQKKSNNRINKFEFKETKKN